MTCCWCYGHGDIKGCPNCGVRSIGTVLVEEAPPMPSVQTPEEEDARERRWHDFISECREFAASERDGYAAALRAVGEAMKLDAPPTA